MMALLLLLLIASAMVRPFFPTRKRLTAAPSGGHFQLRITIVVASPFFFLVLS